MKNLIVKIAKKSTTTATNKFAKATLSTKAAKQVKGGENNHVIIEDYIEG